MRETLIERFMTMTEKNEKIAFVAAGSGIVAKFAEKGGADMIALTAGAYYGMDGLPGCAALMPYGNVNDIVYDLALRIRPVVDQTPLCAGLGASDPTMPIEFHLRRLRELGIGAVINAPTLARIGGSVGENIENAGFGVRRELEVLRLAQDMGFFAIGAALDEATAREVIRLGLDALVAPEDIRTEGILRLELHMPGLSGEIAATVRDFKETKFSRGTGCPGSPADSRDTDRAAPQNPPAPRETVRNRLLAQTAAGKPIILTGAGCGMSARAAEEGGADMAVIYNSGLYRMDGKLSTVGRMPFGNANRIVLQLGERVIPVMRGTPVGAGICGSDPTMDLRAFLAELLFRGFSGVVNFPTVGDLRGKLREELDEAGLGVEKEIETLRLAGEMGLFTMAYAYDEYTAELCGKAGIDLVIAHLGLTKGGSFVTKNSDRIGLDEAAGTVDRIAAAAKTYKHDVMVLAHGGPISSPADTEYIYAHSCAAGFLGASSIERIPLERPIIDAVRRLKNV